MTDPSDEAGTAMQRLHLAIQARQLELDLFWRRALFFWGFISAAFIALASTYGEHPHLAIAVSCFGLVCSLCWSLANRGSKYWYEAWEAKVQREELKCVGRLFADIEPVKPGGGWLSGARFSVSRLAIGLSYFVVVLWVSMLAYQVVVYINVVWPAIGMRAGATFAFVLFTFVFAVVLTLSSRSRERKT